jgi:hypothetical protein
LKELKKNVMETHETKLGTPKKFTLFRN